MFDIKDRIMGRKGREFTEEDLIQVHHNFMVVYGWIPLEEFKEIPTPTLWNLLERVNEEIAKRENLRLVFLKFCGIKNPK